MSQVRVFLLMAVLTAILVGIGNLVGGTPGMLTFFLIALAMNGFSYYFSDSLAIRMTGSEPLPESRAPEIHDMVRRLTVRAGLPMPRIYLTPSPQPNAFATGRDPAHAAVAVTQGLVNLLDRREVEGVLAHEIAHIKNRDTLVGTVAATMAGAVSMIANVAQWGLMFGGMGRDQRDGESNGGASLAASLLMIIVAPIAAALVQMAISRSREYLADETGARLTQDPEGLASALLKLERGAHAIPMEVNPGAAHLFIVNPLSGEALMNLFSTHPPIPERVRRLREMSLRY